MYFFWERKTGFSLKWSGKAGSGPFPDTYLKPPSWLLSLVQGWTLKIVIHDLHHSLGTACQGYHRPLWFSTILRGRSRQSVHIAGLLPLIYHSCSMMLQRMNIWPTVLLFFRNPACSFLSTWSTPLCVLLIMTLPITLLATGNNVTPRQFLHSLRSPLLGIFTIKPFFHRLGYLLLMQYLIKQLCQLLYYYITTCFVQLC